MISAFDDLGPGDLGLPLVISPGDLARCAVISPGDLARWSRPVGPRLAWPPYPCIRTHWRQAAGRSRSVISPGYLARLSRTLKDVITAVILAYVGPIKKILRCLDIDQYNIIEICRPTFSMTLLQSVPHICEPYSNNRQHNFIEDRPM